MSSTPEPTAPTLIVVEVSVRWLPGPITTLPEPPAPAPIFRLPTVTLAPLTMFRLPEDWSPTVRAPGRLTTLPAPETRSAPELLPVWPIVRLAAANVAPDRT